MTARQDIEFGFVAAPTGETSLSDGETYDEILADCELGQELGYGTAWMIEHHFSDYYPTPNPLSFLHFIAARFPDLALGTCVLVTPWYEPLRLAEEIAQLNELTKQPLHLGLGRGTAKMEYDAFRIDMDSSRARFRESYEVLTKALAGGRFTYQGEYLNLPKEIEIRPRTDSSKIHFYGALGASPESAEIMADMGLTPICTTIVNFDKQHEVIARWHERAAAHDINTATPIPLMVHCIIGDSDEAALEDAKTYIPPFMQQQVDHYEGDKDHFKNLQSYKAWSHVFNSMVTKCNPEFMPRWSQFQLAGSPETVCRQLERYMAAGFGNFFLHIATTGIPRAKRHDWMRRFAREVAPRYSTKFKG
ncbi:MAG: LLM class flavin-dependent oxidoreductase [Rhodospirillaceae bacterium]|nr:LLM class flavin-dependent oxidoreductase [Rhodospirillaceae bacterium]